MDKEYNGITTINYGEVHRFYPLKFDRKISMDKLRDKIYESDFVFNESYQNKISSQIRCDLEKFSEDWNQNYVKETTLKVKVVDDNNIIKMESGIPENRKQNLKVEVYEQEGNTLFKLVDEELEALEIRMTQMQNEVKQASNIYGSVYGEMQDRFLLLPIKIKLSNKNQVWLYPILYLFSNHMAILKFELPLVDVTTNALKSNCINDYILETKCTWNEKYNKYCKMQEIKNFYLDKLKSLNVDFWSFNDEFDHVILSGISNIPESINDIEASVREDIFKIVSAPVQNLPTSYEKDVEELFNNYSWGEHNVKSVLKSTGGCFSFCDKQFLECCSIQYLQKEVVDLDEKERKELYNEVVRTIQINVEFAILVIILKKINQHSDLVRKEYSDMSLSDIKREYFESIVYINMLQGNCYGTVYEQISAFERMLPYYLKVELIGERLSAIENILSIEENEKMEEMNRFVSFFGLILSIVFGLPSIYEGLGILRGFFLCIPGDIPILTQVNTSVGLWIMLNVIIWVKMFGKKK